MIPCEQCNRLQTLPLHPGAPASFERSFASDIASGFVRATYKCTSCETFWRWCAPDGWERAYGGELEQGMPYPAAAAAEIRI